MNFRRIATMSLLVMFAAAVYGADHPEWKSESANIDLRQVPTWSEEDLHFFLHGSMSTEFVPEVVLRAFTRTYPDLLGSDYLYDFGLISDGSFGWPIGFSR